MLQAKPGLAPGFVFVGRENILRLCRSGFSRDRLGWDGNAAFPCGAWHRDGFVVLSRLKPLLQGGSSACL
jgi:hypothetical protein